MGQRGHVHAVRRAGFAKPIVAAANWSVGYRRAELLI